jgi:hypothetical protein
VEIFLIVETFCSTNHRKNSVVVIWGEVSLSNFWKQRNWSLEHLFTRISRSKTVGHLFIQIAEINLLSSLTSESYVLRYLHALSFNYRICVICLVIQVVFVSVITDLINLITPTYNLSCVWACYCLQALLIRKSLQSALSELHTTTRIPLRKETCSLTATIAQIIPENHKIIPKNPRG